MSILFYMSIYCQIVDSSFSWLLIDLSSVDSKIKQRRIMLKDSVDAQRSLNAHNSTIENEIEFLEADIAEMRSEADSIRTTRQRIEALKEQGFASQASVDGVDETIASNLEAEKQRNRKLLEEKDALEAKIKIAANRNRAKLTQIRRRIQQLKQQS